MTTIDDTHLDPGPEVWEALGSDVDVKNMGDTYHRPDQKTLQDLKDMAIKQRIDSIQSTNTAGSGYVCSNFMLNFAAWLNLPVAFKA